MLGGLLVGLGCEASLRHVRQAWPDQKNCLVSIAGADEPRQFQGSPDRILGPADMGEGWGGWAAEILGLETMQGV